MNAVKQELKQTFLDTGKSTVLTTEHVDGSIDQTVTVRSLRLNLTTDAPPSKPLVYAIAELEAANKEHRLATQSNVKEWVAYTSRRVKAANLRVQEVQ